MNESTLRIGALMPKVLGTCGDTDNAIVLKERARRRGIATKVVKVSPLGAIPESLDIYAPGDGEDTVQSLVTRKLREDPGLTRALDAGHPLLAICASLQVLGYWYRDTRDQHVVGLGVLDITIDPQGLHPIGEFVSEPILEGLTETLTGFENHGGGIVLGPEAKPPGRVMEGAENGTPEDRELVSVAYDGVAQGSTIATYMHGPCLARNPRLTDLLISCVVGLRLKPLGVPGAGTLRAKRLGTLGA